MSGLTNYALVALLPEGVDRYIALFTTLPADDGVGGVEASVSGYARKAHSSWVNDASGTITKRMNNGAIELAALNDPLAGVVGWGVYDAPTGGNLIVFGELVDSAGDAATVSFVAGEQPRFLDQSLVVGVS